MLSNGYIDTDVQKDFMEKVAGCTEHSETMYQMLQDAKKRQQDICACWIELDNTTNMTCVNG